MKDKLKTLVLSWAKKAWNFWVSLAVLLFTLYFHLWDAIDGWVGFLLFWALLFGFISPHVKFNIRDRDE